MGPDLCRRLGQAVGTREVAPAERSAIAEAAETAEDWDNLPPGIRALVASIERRPLSPSAPA